ncbi:MAG: hypothetical protein H0X49_11495 [Acidobacteria bacterium]|nr:hypothetical protein [Acidobacteriota bacterium]MBA4184620.1 hypothetical protein [Acidobacteriota bacterium]
MKNSILKLSLVGIVSLGLLSATSGQTKKIETKIIEPTAKEAVKQIFLNGDILLSAGKNCESVGTSKDDRTILDFLSGVLSFQTEPNTKSAIEFSFKQEKGRKNEPVWVCDLLFRAGDEESPSSNGIRFKMRNSDRRLMRESVMCIGTG